MANTFIFIAQLISSHRNIKGTHKHHAKVSSQKVIQITTESGTTGTTGMTGTRSTGIAAIDENLDEYQRLQSLLTVEECYIIIAMCM